MAEWIDSAFLQGWMSRERAASHQVSKITSVGILVHENKEKITIVQSLSDNDDAGDGITIPKCSIKRIRTLKIKED